MATQLRQVLSEQAPLIATTVILSLFVVVFQRILAKSHLAAIPYIGAELGNADKRRGAYLAGAKPLYHEGYKRFKNGVFRITASRDAEIVNVAPCFLPELKNLPDDVLSMSEAIKESMEAKYTNLPTDVPIAAHTIKASLTPSLARLNPAIADEVDRTVRAELPPCKDWTEVNINSKLLRIVAIVSGRIFIGPELCHDESYIEAAINYTLDLMAARTAIQRIPPWLKPFKAPRLPEVKKLAQREEDAKNILRPIVTARRKAEREQPGYQKPDDMLQWVMDGQKFGVKEDQELAKIQLGLSFAAIHTTTLTATNAFYSLAADPELALELREEIQNVLAQHGNQFTSPALQNMKKLDSFLKETLRFYPPSFASFQRKLLKPVTLSNGQVLPAGVIIEIPAYGVTRDEDIFEDANKFDALRFYRLREQSETFNKSDRGKSTAVEAAAHNQFVSVSQNSLTFGYGRHACPGRFFAANEIKMIMARAILTYDIHNVGHSRERYPNIEFGSSTLPDPRRNLLFKAI